MADLATANLVYVILHTRVPVGRLVDWVDQAQLYLHLDRAERGYRERRLVRTAPKPAANNNGKARIDQLPPQGDDQAQAAPTPADNGKAPSIRRHPPRATFTPTIHSSTGR